MKKTELVAKMAEEAGLTKVQAEAALNAFVETVKEALAEGDEVPVAGLGKFEVRERARKGINPATKEPIDIPASKAPAFKASTALKALLKK